MTGFDDAREGERERERYQLADWSVGRSTLLGTSRTSVNKQVIVDVVDDDDDYVD